MRTASVGRMDDRDGKAELRKLLDLSALMSIPELTDRERIAFDEAFLRLFPTQDGATSHSRGQSGI